MDFWEKIKNDIRKGIKEGIGMVKEGVTVVKAKAEELSEEGEAKAQNFRAKDESPERDIRAWWKDL